MVVFLNEELELVAFTKTSFQQWGDWLFKCLKRMELIHRLNTSLMGKQLIVSILFFFVEVCVSFYSTVDKNGCICSVKLEFCFFQLFGKIGMNKLSRNNQNKVLLRRCIVSDAELVLNIYFF